MTELAVVSLRVALVVRLAVVVVEVVILLVERVGESHLDLAVTLLREVFARMPEVMNAGLSHLPS
jgi:hypothetical protein